MMDLENLKQMFNFLFCDIDGQAVSHEARKDLHESSTAFVYGEILPDTFQTMLEMAQPKRGEVFYDLGAGTGKAVMWAAMAFPFKKSIGIEFLHGIHVVSRAMLEKYRKDIKPLLPPEKQQQHVDCIQGDFCTVDFSDADVIYTHATCFSDATMKQLSQRFSCLKPGARIITITKNISSPCLELIHNKSYKMDWGNAEVYIYKRVGIEH